jgi:hypothetical protein
MTETVVVEIPKAKKVLGALKKLIKVVETKKALKKVGIAIAELLIDFTAIAAAVSISLAIPSILPKIMSIPAELTTELVPVAVGVAASLVTLMITDLKKKVLRWGEE